MLGALIGLGAGLIGASSGRKEAVKQRNWSEQMSSTAIQRQVEDMKKAGINPILAAQGGGAPMPTASAANVPDFAKSMQSGVTSALQGAQHKKASMQNTLLKDAISFYKKNKGLNNTVSGAVLANEAGLPASYGAALGAAISGKEQLEKDGYQPLDKKPLLRKGGLFKLSTPVKRQYK